MSNISSEAVDIDFYNSPVWESNLDGSFIIYVEFGISAFGSPILANLDFTILSGNPGEEILLQIMDASTNVCETIDGKIFIGDSTDVLVDIKPGSCPNPMRLKCNGVLPVAILGTDDLDVTTLNPDTIMITREGVIGGVPLTRNSYEDVATPFEGELCDCNTLRKDGYMDLTLKFMVGDVVEELMLYEFGDRETIPLTIVGETYGGTPIRGEDCIRVIGDPKQGCNSDLDCDVDVDGSDAAMFKEEFGRRNCWRNNPCIADFQVDGDVDGDDAFTFKSEFGTILLW